MCLVLSEQLFAAFILKAQGNLANKHTAPRLLVGLCVICGWSVLLSSS